MRILICAAFYSPYRGGYAESVRLLAEGLAAHKHAVTIVVCGVGHALREEVITGVHILRVPAWNPSWLHGSFPIPHPFAFWHALSRVRRGGIDIISTQTRFFPSTFIGFLFAKIYGVPVIHTERGSSHTESNNFIIRICGKIIDHTAGWLVCRFSNGVIGVSDAASVFARHLGARHPVTVYNGIDADWWRRPECFTRNDGFFRIAFVGRLVHAKGVQDLFVAVKTLLPDFPLLRISIVGDGPYRTALEARSQALDIAHVIVFHGALEPAGVRKILWQSDMFVNPSHSEGFPRSVLEAAVIGMPIIATNIGGTREIIEDGISGIFINKKNVMALAGVLRVLMGDAGLRVRVGSVAALRAHDFSLKRMTDLYEKNFTTHARIRR